MGSIKQHWRYDIDILAATRDISVTIAAAAGAFFAWRGVSAWRKQLKGQTEYELARKVLSATYKVRNAIGEVRNPYMSSGEQAAALADMASDAEELEAGSKKAAAREQAAAYSVRWRNVSDALRDLDVSRLEAEALWGREAVDRLSEIRECAEELNDALHMYFGRQKQLPATSSRSHFDEEIEQTIGLSIVTESENAFSMRLQEAVDSVELFIRPKLK